MSHDKNAGPDHLHFIKIHKKWYFMKAKIRSFGNDFFKCKQKKIFSPFLGSVCNYYTLPGLIWTTQVTVWYCLHNWLLNEWDYLSEEKIWTFLKIFLFPYLLSIWGIWTHVWYYNLGYLNVFLTQVSPD